MQKRIGFSLMEVVITVLIIGILAAIAMPRYLQHVHRTRDRTYQIKLMLVRDAIERYVVEHDRELPPANSESELKSALDPYLTDLFPDLDLQFDGRPDNFNSAGIDVVNNESLMVGAAHPSNGWKYNSTTGHVIINLDAKTELDPSVSYDDW